MTVRGTVVAFAGITLAAALLAQCTRGERFAVPAGVLVIAQQHEPMSLNPELENGTSSSELGLLLFSYLLKYDSSGHLVGDAATTVPTLRNGGISRNGLTIVYHIRKDIRFADGVPLTARDCVWTIDAINNPRNDVQSRYGYDRIAEADAPNPYTLVLHLKRPFAPVLTLVLAPDGYPILPEHLLARYPNFNDIPFDSKPVGSGPYVVTRWLRGDRIEMRANPNYWRGKPKIARITIRFVPDATTAIDLLRTHEVDGYFDDLDPRNYPVLRSIPGIRVTSTRLDAVGALIFNTRSPLTSDPRVRHAIAMAIDTHSLVAKVYRGALDSRNAGRGLFIWAYDPQAFKDVPYDPKRARRLLQQAGWTMGAGGIRRKDGRALDLLLIIQADTPSDAMAGNIIAQYERAIGAGVTLKQFNVTQFVAPPAMGGPIYGGKFDLALYPFINGDDPDTTDQFACSHVPPAGYNKSRICDPRIDALLYAGRATYDAAKRIAIYRRLQARLYRELPLVLLYQGRQINAFTDRLHGDTASLNGIFWNVGAWRLSPRPDRRALDRSARPL